jgi:hypothetical protein
MDARRDQLRYDRQEPILSKAQFLTPATDELEKTSIGGRKTEANPCARKSLREWWLLHPRVVFDRSTALQAENRRKVALTYD